MLVSHFLKKDYQAHNAMADVAALEELYYCKLQPTPAGLEKAVFSVNYVTCMHSLQGLVGSKVLSADIQRRLACSGIGLPQLRKVHERDPHNGIAALFKEPFNCAPKDVKITRSGKVIERVKDFLSG